MAGQDGGGGGLTVLMVAEKPSIAKALASAFCPGRPRERTGISQRSPVFEFWSKFMGEDATFRVTATQGHVYSFDFGEEYNDWTRHGPEELFSAPIVRTFESTSRMPEHLAAEAEGCHALVLWLDCDREGENICFEVMQNVLPNLDRSRKFKGAYMERVFRAKFSSLRHTDLRSALENLGVPNENEAQSVDARAEIDLRLGVAFSRFQTQYFKRHFGAQLGSVVKTVSYGPCQMPTLWFCVHRHCQIQAFKPKPYWTFVVNLKGQGESFVAESSAGRFWNKDNGLEILAKSRLSSTAKVTAMARRIVTKARPLPLNTVAMLQKASERAGISPGDAMHCAEQLYLKGILSYPRTETSKYPAGFDVLAVAQLLNNPGAPWAQYSQEIVSSHTAPRTDGTDVGDHPPITPVKYVTESQCGDSGTWELYKLVCEHFLATLSPDCILDATEVQLDLAGQSLVAKSSRKKSGGFCWADVVRETIKQEGDADLSWLPNGTTCNVMGVELKEQETVAPKHLTESELLGKLEKHGVGTDASMATHVSNIQKRGYVQLDEANRQLMPQPLGLALTHAYTLVDPALIRPTVRSAIENACSRVAKGQAKKKEVVAQAIGVFERKFKNFRRRVHKLPAMLAVAYTREKATGGDGSGKDKEYTEEEWRQWAEKKKEQNPDKGFSVEEWLEWLKQRHGASKPASGEGGRAGASEGGAGGEAAGAAGEAAAGGQKSAAEAQWDLAAGATAAISLDELLRDRGNAELRDEPTPEAKAAAAAAATASSLPAMRPGAEVRLHSLKGAAELNGQLGTCSHHDPATGRWHIKLPSGEVKALKAENLTPTASATPAAASGEGGSGPVLRPGALVVVHGLKAAPQLNGQEGLCEQWDAAKGRWTVRLVSGEVKALKPDNLQEEEGAPGGGESEDAINFRTVARVQRELESLGFGRGSSGSAFGGKGGGGKRRHDGADSGGRDQPPFKSRAANADGWGSSPGGQWRGAPSGESPSQSSKPPFQSQAQNSDDWGSRRGAAAGESPSQSSNNDWNSDWKGKWSNQRSDAWSKSWQDDSRSDGRRDGDKGWKSSGDGDWSDQRRKSSGDDGRSEQSHKPAEEDRSGKRERASGDDGWSAKRWKSSGGEGRSEQSSVSNRWRSHRDRDRDRRDSDRRDSDRRDSDRRDSDRRDSDRRGSDRRDSDRRDSDRRDSDRRDSDRRDSDRRGSDRRDSDRRDSDRDRRDSDRRGSDRRDSDRRDSDRRSSRGEGSDNRSDQRDYNRSGHQDRGDDRRQQQPPPPLPQMQFPPQMMQPPQGLGFAGQPPPGLGFAGQPPPGLGFAPGQPPPPPMQVPPPMQPPQGFFQPPPGMQPLRPPAFGGGRPPTPGPTTAVRMALKRRVFSGCDKGRDGFLSEQEMLSLAVLTGFDGSDEDWNAEYVRLCRDCNADPRVGIPETTLHYLLDDRSDVGFFCEDKQLEEMAAALEDDSDA